MASGNRDILDQFCAVTGATLETGRRLLEVCNNDLEMAIGMHLDTGGSGDPTDIGASSSSGGACGNDSDGVRAPIPQKQEVLVEEEYGYSFGFRGRRRPTRSVFDGLRDFRAEARQQELMVENGSGSSVVNKKRKTLEDLFRPPIDLIHKGTFNSAKEAGILANKWLMVNIQNVQEFACQALNRDVWSSTAVKHLVMEHFIFWQVYHDSEEGQRYAQFYNVQHWPCVAVIDPRTGEKMVDWSKLDAMTFCDLANQFLSVHSAPDPAATSPPAKKLRRNDSIVDATEDQQIQAAIRASLEDVKNPPSSKKTLITVSDSDDDDDVCGDDDNNDVDGDEVETFTDSDDDSVSVSSEHSKESCVKKEKSSNGEKLGISIAKNGHCEQSKGKQIVSSNSKSGGEIDVTTADNEEKWKQFLGNENDDKSSIMIRFTDGRREQFTVPCSSKLMALVQFVVGKGYSNEQYELVTNYPRRKLSFMDFDSTLKEVGLFPQETVFVQER